MIGMLYVIYLLLSIVILTIFRRKSKQEWLLKIIVVAVLPIVGWLLPLFWPRAIYREKDEAFEDYVARQQEEHEVRRSGVYTKIERDKELNVIPIEDALLVSEHQTRRQVMIDVLKQDSINYIEVLQRAVSNEDTETSHYAVSAIMETKRKLMISLQQLSVKYEQHRDDVYVVTAYAEILKAYLQSGYLDERTLLKYRYTFISVVEQLISLSDDEEWAHKEKTNMELVLGEYARAERSGLLYTEKCPHSEDAYITLMKVYYETNSYDKLQQTLERLLKTPIRLSNQALTIVRFWSEGA